MLDGAAEGSNHAPSVVSSQVPCGGDGLAGSATLTLHTDVSRLEQTLQYLMT